MPLYMIREDITRMNVDAIVDPTDRWYSGSGGSDLAIHTAAGPELEAELARLAYLDVGEASVTGGYDLPAKYIIHTYGPIWQDGEHGEAELLERCYLNSLRLAEEKGCRSVAFPVISGGTFGYPNDDALQIARNTIGDYLQERDMTVYIVAYRRSTFNLGARLFSGVPSDDGRAYSLPLDADGVRKEEEKADGEDTESLDYLLRHRGETFAVMLDRLRYERALKGPELYKKAWVHKSVYSKIMSNVNYTPAKVTAVAFGLALELPWEEFSALVASAGYSVTNNNLFDIVVGYFVRSGDYRIIEINSVLYDLDPGAQLIGV